MHFERLPFSQKIAFLSNFSQTKECREWSSKQENLCENLSRKLKKNEGIEGNCVTTYNTLNLGLSVANVKKTILEDWVSETQLKTKYFAVYRT